MSFCFFRYLKPSAAMMAGVAFAFLPTPDGYQNARAEAEVTSSRPDEPDIDLFALMSGKCERVRIAEQDLACRAVAYFHSQQGRANFTIAIDDPEDAERVVAFSGMKGERVQDNRYELAVDRMLFYSKSTPKVEGLPVPTFALSSGGCTQIGSFATGALASIACSATDQSGRKYELKFVSDGQPMQVRKIKQASLEEEKRAAWQREQMECRRKAAAAMVLPRDLTEFLLKCLEEVGAEPLPRAQ